MDELEEKSLIDYKKYLRILIKFWYVAFLFIAVSYLIAFLKIRYATPVYKVTTTLQIKDKSSHSSSSRNFLEGASMFQPYKNLKNEIELIKSYNRIQLVVKEMNVTWNYILKGKFRDIEAYNKAPIQIETDSSLIVTNVPLKLKIIDSEYYELTVNAPAVRLYDSKEYKYTDSMNQAVSVNQKKIKYGELVSIGTFHFRIVKTPYFFSEKDEECYLVARDLHQLTKIYKGKIVITENEKSSIINISSVGPIVGLEVDFLSKLSEVYVRKELEDKNLIATNTINFIDSQLNIISDSLKNTEGNIQSYKERNKVFAVGQEAESKYTLLSDLETKKLTLEIQLRYYEYLKEYLYSDKEANDLVAPSTINISEGILNNLVAELILLHQQKNTLKYSSSEKSPAYQTTLIKIKSTKEALLETTNNLVKTSKSSIADLDKRIYKLEQEMAKIPAKERNLINIQRQHTINDNIYNYLLQKRAEASIARASNLSDAFVVESAREDEYVQIAPITQKIYMNHLLVGLLLISVSVVIYGKFDNKVHEKEEIEKFTSSKIIGTIPFISNAHEEKFVSEGHGRLTESFRSLRTNLRFILQGKNKFSIGITSCISGDGKSFCSYNLARVYAISGKKTILVRGDLRKNVKQLDNNLSPATKGLSEYLIGAATLEDIIQPGDIANFSLIVPGPIPPNASELFASSQMIEFINALNEKFDVLIIDSPPVGLVSDYISIMNLLDVNVYVVRQDYTPKESLNIIKEIKNKNTDSKGTHTIVYNGVTGQGAEGYYGYGVDQSEKIWWKKMLNIK
jgi:tyrosine-protein kinase Etk/Wzc